MRRRFNGESESVMELKEENSVKKSLFTFIFEKNGFIREWILPIIAAMALALIINKFVVYNVYIPSESMVPTLNVGDKLVVTKIYDTSKIQRGDVIVFYSEELNQILIKRAIGLPGDLSSQSRFVRASFVKMNSVSGDTENETRVLQVKDCRARL